MKDKTPLRFNPLKEIKLPNGVTVREPGVIERDADHKIICDETTGQPKMTEGKALTLGAIAMAELLKPEVDMEKRAPVQIPADEQSARFKLSVKIANAEEAGLPAKLTIEEGRLLKKLIAKRGEPLIFGRFVEELEGPDDEDVPDGIVEPPKPNGASDHLNA